MFFKYESQSGTKKSKEGGKKKWLDEKNVSQHVIHIQAQCRCPCPSEVFALHFVSCHSFCIFRLVNIAFSGIDFQ